MRLRLIPLFALMLLLQACDTELYSDLEQREANRMVAVLLERGIAADRVMQKDGRLTVTVDKRRFADAVSLLEDAGLPEQSFTNLGEVFQNNGLVSSPVQERAQMIYALSEELSHTVSQVDGVLSARVHVVLPDNDLLKRNTVPSSASVFIRHEPGLDINRLLPQVKTLVANGISGLSYEGVSVIPVEAPAPVERATEPLVRFFGITLQQASLDQARWVFGSLLLTVLALAGVCIWLLRRPAVGARVYPLVPRT
ncbi:type III secretion system inner membrane ring lipoprotein SctJ [Pseudomonas sp. YJ42]|jgi:type III secretion protein J|uniref:type III secretion system inner membrane ring lipoprotein SctJ n=1 Tax=Pseudomonas sp. YJ42 TaxID=3392115 RepID=UPI0039A3750F